MYQLEDVQALEQQNQRRLLLEDLIDIEKKKDEANKVFR